MCPMAFKNTILNYVRSTIFVSFRLFFLQIPLIIPPTNLHLLCLCGVDMRRQELLAKPSFSLFRVGSQWMGVVV